jgi:AcrR family transcriptional regulator
MPIADETQERLLEAAGQVFAAKGFQAATVREICQQAEANIAAVNYHFGDKEKLYVEAFLRAFRAQMEQVPLPPWTADTPAATRLRDFILTFIHRVVVNRSPAWHTQLIMREVFQPTAACEQFVRQFVRPHFEILMDILRELLPADVPEAKRRLIVFSIIGQCLYHRVGRHVIAHLVGDEEYRTYDATRLAEHIADFSLAALGVVPPLGERGTRP